MKLLQSGPILTAMEHRHNLSPTLPNDQFANLGTGQVAYVKSIGADDAKRMVGQAIPVGPSGKLFALYNANGAPISISQTLEAAIDNASEHELVAARVH